MTAETRALSRCPFCGAEARMIAYFDSYSRTWAAHAQCKMCWASVGEVGGRSEATATTKATRKWNQRFEEKKEAGT